MCLRVEFDSESKFDTEFDPEFVSESNSASVCDTDEFVSESNSVSVCKFDFELDSEFRSELITW